MKYSIELITSLNFTDAVQELTQLLDYEGFGVLTEIDVKATFKDKLDLDFRPYKILGTCNAALARQAIELEPSIGALMPCNWTVQQLDGGQIQVSVMNPASLIDITGNLALQPIVNEVNERVLRIISRLPTEQA